MRLCVAHAIDERHEGAHDRAESRVKTRRPGAPQAIDQRELASAREMVRVSLSCAVFINQISDRWSLFAIITANGTRIAHAEPDRVKRG
jgi:hypothetical protein